jgi:pSer/pThr/pTyr-binding forkhead associated (FHA) protein
MAKLVILNQGMTGRSHELAVDRTTIGRVEDNTFHIADGSVSSHHCEVHLRGAEILIRDLNSTNGTFINNEKISEAVLKPGQTLRFGQVEIKIDDGSPVTAPPPPAPVASGSAPIPAPAPVKKSVEGTMIIPRGVSLTDLEQSGVRPSGFDTNASFSKKSNKTNKYFLIVGIVVGVVILGLIVYALMQAGGQSTPAH